MAQNGGKWFNIIGNCWLWLEIAGKGWKDMNWLDRLHKTGDGWKWL